MSSHFKDLLRLRTYKAICVGQVELLENAA